MSSKQGILESIRVISIAMNVPGPAAAATLLNMGAKVTKIEPPGGDFLEKLSPSWYEDLAAGQEILRIDLKTAHGLAELEALLTSGDLLITSTRHSALKRLSLDWETLHSRHPRLCHVEIVGYAAPDEDKAGHDLTYMAATGLLTPPILPRTLLADMVGAERTTSSALALLFAREKGLGARHAVVSLSSGAEILAEPLRHGLTAANGILGGGLPRYNLYETDQGWIALAALEQHFWDRLTHALGIPDIGTTSDDLQKIFLSRTASEWEEWAAGLDIPIVAVQEWT